ncbi:hypothetical protein DPMN_136448 [Dreissena polymorpha]|uniref:Uncharacterized protein n=1 Tax=Dreissena polymorpha TaxID=45954 RepID=A0A9D4JGQ6_DREPO|nr:hypothetical protein DPMN_136448 [Dreissena polymorpha]
MIRYFDVKKRTFEFDSHNDILLGLKDSSDKLSLQSLWNRLAPFKYGDKVVLRGRYKLGIDSSIIQRWFTDPLSRTVIHISSVPKEDCMKDVCLIVLPLLCLNLVSLIHSAPSRAS